MNPRSPGSFERGTEKPLAVDLFAGAGGLTLGLEAAGFATALATDYWPPASATIVRNFEGINYLFADATELTGADILNCASLVQGPDLVVGGPPCQGFSSAGARRRSDSRNTLVSTFARLVAELRPRAFVFENVEGFLTLDGGSFVVDLLDPVIEAGYYVSLRKVNVANYGVPQLRKRSIAIGTLGTRPDELSPTHRAFGAPGAHIVGKHLSPTQTVGEALRGLPQPGSPDSPSDHEVPNMSALDHRRTTLLAPGQTMRDLPGPLQHASFSRRANRRVSDGMPSERRGGAPAGLRRLQQDAPSKAITSAASREFVHPSEDRPLTLRECARLQTFPDWFDFEGSRSDRATLIGNAVPPEFGRVIGETVLPTMQRAERSFAGEGRLVSFEPTAGQAVSPALARVKTLIARRYGRLSTGDEVALWG
jgi:DNA (cytosine-5)-methyltransferase 1